MKRALIFSLAALMALSVSAFGFFGFGYTHGIPDNDGKLWAGFEFGPDESTFNIDVYFADIWTLDQSVPVTPNKSDICLGIDAFYVGDTDLVDVEVGTYFESIPLTDWPVVGIGEIGFYGDMTLHVLEPDILTGNTITWDLFASFGLGVDVGTGTLDLDAEIGFEVEL